MLNKKIIQLNVELVLNENTSICWYIGSTAKPVISYMLYNYHQHCFCFFFQLLPLMKNDGIGKNDGEYSLI